MKRKPPPTVTQQVRELLELLRDDKRPAKLVVANKQMTVRIEIGSNSRGVSAIGFEVENEDADDEDGD